MTLVDTNVLLDLVTDGAEWAPWSVKRLEAASLEGPLLINDVIYAELSVGYQTIEKYERILQRLGVSIIAIPRAALFLAGKAFRHYRAAGGRRTGVLTDFFIGAHASVAGLPLLTRDGRRYRTHFPAVDLITP